MEKFHEYVGEIMMYCQCIEENIKRIYSYMQPGNYERNRLSIENEKMTLGQVITAMKDLDEHRSSPSFFKPRDYDLLFKVTRTRNLYAHNVYIAFCYLDDGRDFDENYSLCAERLMKDHEWLYKLYESVEDARMKFESDC